MNRLEHTEEFKRVLANYRLSSDAKQTLGQTKLVLLVGPSSSGRNTIINELLKFGSYHYIVSDTTRQPRVNNGILEHDGREYWFRTEAELLADLKAGEFLEAAVIHDQQVSGMSIRELKAAADEDKIAISEIEVVGAGNIHVAKPDALIFFVLPPSFDEWIARMTMRGALPADEVRRRLQSAVTEITSALKQNYYCFIVNDTYTHAAKRIDQIIQENSEDMQEQQKAKELAAQILEDTRLYLATLADV